MSLRQEVLDAFNVLQLDPNVEYSVALKSYKRLALIHHPDRNHGDNSATERFQQIGAAWNICQRHFDNPAWSRNIPNPSHTSCHHRHHHHFNTYEEDDDDDDYYFMDEDDLHAYYMFMFAETLANRFSRARRKHYRHQRSRASAAPGVYSFYPAFSDDLDHPDHSKADQQERQRREKEEYEKRKRELELEIEEEERQKEKAAKEAQANLDRKASLVDTIFQAAYAGDSSAVRKAILENDLDVNTPRKRAKHTRKQGEDLQHESLLHVAASHCDDELVMFLVERGADTKTLNKQQLTPFHAAIKAGNTRVVRFIMERRGRSFEGYHPSKAAPSGRTPLQLAIDSHQPSMIELLVREATTHDVERCWKQGDLSEDIKNILRTKKGFVPPEEVQKQEIPSHSSKKSSRKQEISREKAAQLALEQERARVNRERREERAAKRAEQERERKAQEEEEEIARRKAELAEKRRLEEEEARRQHKEQESLRKTQEAKAELQRRLVQENERLKQAEAEGQRRADELRRISQEAKLCSPLVDTGRPSKGRQTALGKSEPADQITLKTQHRLTSQRPDNVSTQRRSQQPVQTKEQMEPAATQEPLLLSPSITPVGPLGSASRTDQPAKRERLTEDERKTMRRENQREKRRTKAAMRAHSEQSLSQPEVQATLPKLVGGPKVTTHLRINKKPEDMTSEEREEYEQVLRRRAEQSARDKQRAQAWREKRAQRLRSPSPTGYVPLTPVSMHTHSRHQTPEQSMATFSIRPSRTMDTMMLEEIQTCIVPDDLFREDRQGDMNHGDFARTVGSIDELFLKEGEEGPYVRV